MKLPPIEKIPEAYSAIADNRVEMKEQIAFVKSSDLQKEYKVVWEDDMYASSDSATYWQGYPGYPIIAVLMLQERLSLDKDIVQVFQGINWTALNKKHKRDYANAVEEVLNTLEEQGHHKEKIVSEMNLVYEEIKLLQLEIKKTTNRKAKKA